MDGGSPRARLRAASKSAVDDEQLTRPKTPTTLTPMRLLAPAKINLHLRVFGVQSDGFHPLLSWMSTVGLFDRIEIERTENGIALSCDVPGIPVDARNLVHRAAQLMLSERTKPTAAPWERPRG